MKEAVPSLIPIQQFPFFFLESVSDFIATEERIQYFMEVLTTKLKKYIHLNSFRPKSPTRHIPLALSMAGFVRYYWPGKVVCCGSIRESISVLEHHINRVHRPPKAPPVLSMVPSSLQTQNGSHVFESDVSDEVVISPNIARSTFSFLYEFYVYHRNFQLNHWFFSRLILICRPCC